MSGAEDVDVSPPVYRGHVKIFTVYFALWRVWRPRSIILDKGILSICEVEHLTEKESIPLNGFTVSPDKYLGSFVADPTHECSSLRQLALSRGDKVYYILLSSVEEKPAFLAILQKHVYYATVMYGINVSEAYLQFKPTDPVDADDESEMRQSGSSIGSSLLPVSESGGLQPPDVMTGWLTKRGQFIQSWRKRFFVLEGGVLSYYTDRSPTDRKKGVGLKGSLKLWNFLISLTVEPGKIHLSTDSSDINAKHFVMILYATPEQKNKKWARALHQHIRYGKYLVKLHRKSRKASLTDLLEGPKNPTEKEDDGESLRSLSPVNYTYPDEKNVVNTEVSDEDDGTATALHDDEDDDIEEEEEAAVEDGGGAATKVS